MTAHVDRSLSAYLDSELPAPERAAVEAHLEACADCARRLAQLAAVDEAARGLSLNAPAGYFEAFPERLRARLERPKRATRRLPVWGLALAATLLLAVLTPALLPRAGRAPAPGPELPVAARQSARGPSARPAEAPTTPPDAKRDEARAPGYVTLDDRAPAASAEVPRKLAPPMSEADAAKRSGPSQDRALAAPVVVPPAPQAPPATLGLAPQESLALASAEQRGALDVSDRGRAQEAKKEAGPGRRAPEQGAQGDASTELGKARLVETRYARLLARGPASSAAEALATRDAWRGFLRDHAAHARADEARVHAIEAGVALYRLSHEHRDLESVRQDAAAYLERGDALQAERVRKLLRDIER